MVTRMTTRAQKWMYHPSKPTVESLTSLDLLYRGAYT